MNSNLNSISVSRLSGNYFECVFNLLVERLPVTTLADKTQFILTLCQSVEELINNTENQNSLMHWGHIANMFGGAMGLSGLALVSPAIAPLIAIGSAVGAIGGLVSGNLHQRKTKEIIECLHRHLITLKSSPAADWACLWEFEPSAFLQSLREASKGVISQSKIIREDSKNPYKASVEFCAQYTSMLPDDVISELKQIKVGGIRKPSKSTQIVTPVTSVNTSASQSIALPPVKDALSAPASQQDFYGVAEQVLDHLVGKSSNKQLGGCIILAAPGSGKTTFLGTAWGRLQQQYGSKFVSLAIVVKASDVDAFRACSDKAMCIKGNLVSCAVEIIKFIQLGMNHDGIVKRLFLDDFLTMVQYFDALKGKYINPEKFYVYMDSKEVKEAQDMEAVSLHDCLMRSLNEAYLVGREYNLCLWVSSHSPNVAALPFVGSRDSRSVGDLIFLARDDKREFISLALSNPNLISDGNRRQALNQVLNQNSSGSEPWILANLGNWSLGIVSGKTYEEYQTYRNEWDKKKADSELKTLELNKTAIQSDKSDKTVKPVDTRVELEKLFNAPSAPEPKILPPHPLAPKIIEILQNAMGDRVTFNAFRTSRRWNDDRPKSEQLREVLQLLVNENILEGDDELGYKLA